MDSQKRLHCWHLVRVCVTFNENFKNHITHIILNGWVEVLKEKKTTLAITTRRGILVEAKDFLFDLLYRRYQSKGFINLLIQEEIEGFLN